MFQIKILLRISAWRSEKKVEGIPIFLEFYYFLRSGTTKSWIDSIKFFKFSNQLDPRSFNKLISYGQLIFTIALPIRYRFYAKIIQPRAVEPLPVIYLRSKHRKVAKARLVVLIARTVECGSHEKVSILLGKSAFRPSNR